MGCAILGPRASLVVPEEGIPKEHNLKASLGVKETQELVLQSLRWGRMVGASMQHASGAHPLPDLLVPTLFLAEACSLLQPLGQAP